MIATNDILKNFENIIGGQVMIALKVIAQNNKLDGGSAGLDTADYSDSAAFNSCSYGYNHKNSNNRNRYRYP